METYITKTPPAIYSDELPPDNVLFIGYLVCRENTKKGGESKITSVLRCFAESMHMVNTNKYLEDKNIGNGSRRKFKMVKLKPGARPV